MVAKYPMLSFEHSWDNFNYNIQDISGKRGTLQYLLDDTNYGIYPCITSAFWGTFDDNKVYSNDVIYDMFFNGGDLIKDYLLNYNNTISKLKSKYNMNNNQIILLEKIFKNKVKEKNKAIFLSKSDIKLIDIPNYEGFKESKVSFSEIGVYFIK